MKFKALFLVLFLASNTQAQPNMKDYSADPKSMQTPEKIITEFNASVLKSASYLLMSEKLSFGKDSLPLNRGVKDAILFKNQASSVVLIMTDDGLGSGSLISSDGYILTNKHVVGDSKNVGVFFKPEKDTQKITKESLVNGRVMKVDDLTDLALVKVENIPNGRNPVKLGREDDIGIGLDVHAIGHPKGEYWTYTKGVISQYRPDFEWTGSLNGAGHKANVIQTQTPINPGNSGGPLFLDSGILIGVNSFKNSDAEGLNFAVSIEEVKSFLNRKGDRVLTKPVTQPAKCAAKLLFKGRTEKNNANMETYDSNCLGRVDVDFVYPDDVKEPYISRVYRKSESKFDGIVYSFKRDDKWDLSYWDNNNDNTWPVVGLHKNGEWLPIKYISRSEHEKGKK
jgi:S1-C subfamily serine protease